MFYMYQELCVSAFIFYILDALALGWIKSGENVIPGLQTLNFHFHTFL